MHRFVAIAALVTGVAIMQPVLADKEKAQAAGCMACHQVAVKVVGPAYKDVAAKYKDDADAKAMLIAKVRSGGVGTWGQVPMPSNAVISDADLSAVMDWVLAQ